MAGRRSYRRSPEFSRRFSPLDITEVHAYKMLDNDQSAGATPVVGGARPSQSYPFGPGFAAYRLPFPSANAIGSRAVGVCFEGEPSGGATPPGDPPPAQSPAPPADAPPPPATGDPDALGDAGKRALEAERAGRAEEKRLRVAAETERDELKRKTLSESEQAVAAAKDAGKAEASERFHGQIRRSEVKAALSGAGINPSVMDLAAKADEFAKLTVNDEGEVEGLPEAVKAFKAARGDLFKVDPGDGSADGGARGGRSSPAKTLEEALEREYASPKR